MASSNQVTLTFAGDSRNVEQAMDRVGSATQDMAGEVGQGTDQFAASMDKFAAAGLAGEAIAGLGDTVTAVTDMMAHGDRKAVALARAHEDVAQASQDAAQALEDMEQAERDVAQAGLDAEQAGIDLKQALLDQAQAQRDYNDAVAEHGKGSAEARQADLDLAQARLDAKQASEDAEQATRDLAQGHLDAKQAVLDHAAADTSLTEAQLELAAQSSTMTQIGEWTGMLTGLLGGLVGIIGVAAAVQWAWNAAMIANPIGLIVVAIAALIGIIILIAVKTTWFQDLWKVVWGGIKKAALGVWHWLRDDLWPGITGLFDRLGRMFRSIPKKIGRAFSGLFDIIVSPFRSAFNFVADAWNNTIGSLSWSVPGWVPGIGGNSLSAPRLPHFHTGGIVSGALGAETLAVVRAGERVTAAGGGDGGQTVRLELAGDREVVAFMRTLIRKYDLLQAA